MRRTLLASLLAFGVPMMALADEPAAAPAPVVTAAAPARAPRLVGVILSSAQALLWDEERGEYVLHKVGEDALGGRLVELDADHIVIERGESREVFEISAPPQMRVAGRRQPKRLPAMLISAANEGREGVAPVAVAAPAVAAPVAVSAPVVAAPVAVTSPGAEVAPAAPAMVAPPPTAQLAMPAPASMAAPAPVVLPPPPVVLAPPPVVAPPLPTTAAIVAPPPPAVVVAPPPALFAPPPPAAVVAPPAAAFVAPVVAPAPLATPPVAAPVAPSLPTTPTVAPAVSAYRRPVSAVQLSRNDLDRELGDFAALSQDVQVAAQPDGGFRLALVRTGSFFERIGLRTNDVVLRVDGRPINGVEDASAAYAWLRVTNRFSVDVVRDGRPMTLRYVIGPARPLSASAQ